MQDLPAIREWIDITLTNYSKQIGHPKPELNFDSEKEDRHKHSDCDAKAKYNKAISCNKCNTLFINLEHNTSIKDVEDSIVHELVHLRFEIPHSPNFYKIMGMIMMGKTYRRRRYKKK